MQERGDLRYPFHGSVEGTGKVGGPEDEKDKVRVCVHLCVQQGVNVSGMKVVWCGVVICRPSPSQLLRLVPSWWRCVWQEESPAEGRGCLCGPLLCALWFDLDVEWLWLVCT